MLLSFFLVRSSCYAFSLLILVFVCGNLLAPGFRFLAFFRSYLSYGALENCASSIGGWPGGASALGGWPGASA